MLPFTAQCAVTQSDCLLASPEKKIGTLDLTRIVASTLPVSFTMKNILAGFKIQVFGHFKEMHLVMNILKLDLFMWWD
jgi:hypothetical protein